MTPQPETAAELHLSLNAIIRQMQAIQEQIGGSSQPASMHELDALSALGRQYSDLVERLQGTF